MEGKHNLIENINTYSTSSLHTFLGIDLFGELGGFSGKIEPELLF